MIKITKWLLLLSLCAQHAHQANILLVGTLLSHSHHFWNEGIAVGLAEKGHNVTMLSHDTTKTKRDNFTVITLEGVYETFDNTYTMENMAQFTISPFNIPSFVDQFWSFNLAICAHDIKHPTLHKVLLNYPRDFRFDVILWDHTAGECLYPLVEHFGNPPLIGLSPFGLTNTLEDLYGGHVYPYVGQVVMPFVEATSLWQRMLNAFYINYANYRRNTWLKRESVALARRTFWDWDEYKYDRTEERFSLSLVNWNAALNQPQPMLPNIIPVGGVQIKDNEPLPKQFQAIFDKSTAGVIFFSLGSNIKSEMLSVNILQSFAQCFSELPDHQVIWKLTPPAGLKLPPNVNTVQWAPQTAILAQAQTKLFITHGGGLSTQETTYFGVPIVGFPVFLDQINNVNKLRAKGAAEAVTYADVMKAKRDVFCQRVKKVLFTDSYSRAMKDLSAKYRDTETRPLETAIYWVEYVLRHGDITHLSPLSRKMSAFYTQNIDIYAITFAFVGLQVYLIWMLVRCLWRRCRRSKPPKTPLKSE